jgi:preprotein translocase subunit SecE
MAKQQQSEEKKPSTGQLDIKNRYAQVKDFFEKSKLELKKTTWPTKKETRATCFAVVILVVVMSLFLGLVDFALSNIVKAILH